MKSKDIERQAQIEKDIVKFSTIVYTIAYNNTDCKADAEDVFQEVFIKYCKYFNRLNDDEHKEKWLKKTTKHTSINFNKNKKKNHCLELDENILIEPLDDIYKEKPTQFLDYLRDTYKVVLKLYYCNNLRVKEIGKKLNITESAVKTRLKRGRNALKELINKAEY